MLVQVDASAVDTIDLETVLSDLLMRLLRDLGIQLMAAYLVVRLLLALVMA